MGKVLVGPVVTLGYSPEHSSFAGTVSVSKETLRGIIHDIAESHARSGFKLVYFWIGHGGDNVVLQEVLPELKNKWPGCTVTGIADLEAYIAATWDQRAARTGDGSRTIGLARRRVRDLDDAGRPAGPGAGWTRPKRVTWLRLRASATR